ncbi:DUF3667 domain-containing protein [Maricaulis sp.]|uniref:DUF3667 domain-containing protein n=1 Tax=Maricaulis sp. TaxID=1486257 RepID=UPI002B26A5F4|nr:DUF3667 domain-containing protein [Maricaulis sp.]
MSHPEKAGSDTTTPESCANCGAALTGPFCGQCGQSSTEIRRPILVLVTDTIGDIFVWDGRFLSTLRALFSRPGTLARAYADGQRARWTPPIRLYLLVSLAFFTAMSLGGVRVIAVDAAPTAEIIRQQDPVILAERRERIETALDAAGGAPSIRNCGVMPGPEEVNAQGQLVFAADTDFQITLMQTGAASEARLVDAETDACLHEYLATLGMPPLIGRLSVEALRDPAGLEARSSAAAAQAVILMVIALALINFAVHPRRKLIEHVILSLYLHAVLLPGFAVTLLLSHTLGGQGTAAAITVALLAQLAQLVLFWLADRQFYGSSWWGALLRLPLQVIGYAAALTLAALLLIVLPIF